MNDLDLPPSPPGFSADPEARLDTSIELLPYVLNRLTTRINQVWLDAIRADGLTVPRWQVLAILAAFDGQRVGRIAQMSGNEQPVVSRVIDQMERDGLVTRRRAEADSRAVEVWLTTRGRSVYDRLAPAAGRFVERLVHGIDRGEVASTMSLLLRLLDQLDDDARRVG